MKFFLFAILIVSFNCLSQEWIVDDGRIDTNHVTYYDWYRLMPDLTEIYCGLFDDTDSFDYHYSKHIGRDDLVFCNVTNKEDGSYQIGYLRLTEIENGKYCWFPDVFWFYFDEQGKLVEQLFYNNGQQIIPKEFEVIIDYE